MRWKFALPLVLFLGLMALLLGGLGLNMRDIPSAEIGKRAPLFDLPPVGKLAPGLATSDLGHGQVVLVNVFASWCVTCRAEQPLLLALKEKGTVPIYGIDYKDEPTAAVAWLDELGDPYSRIGADRNGRTSINWGVYGVPETYVITKDGRIAYKQIGPVTEAALKDKILPLVKKLQAAP